MFSIDISQESYNYKFTAYTTTKKKFSTEIHLLFNSA